MMKEVEIMLTGCDIDMKPSEFVNKVLTYGLGFGLGIGLIFVNYSVQTSITVGFLAFILFEVCVYSILLITREKRITLIEENLPDFLNMMAGNIRSGLTYDRALLLSARKDFGPLAKEIDKTAKETISGTPLATSMMNMAIRVRSELFSKTIRLIVEGFNSGGNLAELLEGTAKDIRKFDAIRKEVSATIMVYRLFVFAAAAFGAPLLYAVAGFLVQVVTEMRGKIGSGITSGSNLPFFSTTTGITPDTVFLFSLAAMGITGLFAALAAGVISKGKESEGLSYVPVLLGISFVIFFVVKFILETAVKGFFAI